MEDLNSDEVKMMVTALKEMKVKPDLESPAAFKDWMVKYVTGLNVKQESHDEGDGSDTNNSASGNSGSVKSVFIPKIPTFSGDGSKQDTSYELWKYQVECLLKDKYSESVVAQSARRSLRGEAGKVAMRLGSDANIKQLMEKMESVFGTVERGESIMEEFYSATQRKSENTMEWSCRLEEIYSKAVAKGVAKREEANEKLKSRFWNGLHQWLRDITGYKYDRIEEFDELRKEVRLVEKEHDKKATTSMAITTDKDSDRSELQEIKGMIHQLTTKVNQLESGYQQRDNKQPSQSASTPGDRIQQDKRQQQRGGYTNRGGNRNRGGRGGYNQQHGAYGGQGCGGDCYQQDIYHDSHHYNRGQQEYGQPQQPQNYYDEPICYRCGQPGHLARGCRVILDHSKRGLNFNRPSSRGRW